MSYHSDFLNYTPNKKLLENRTIVITGASGGIGKTMALACAAAGATVVLLGRTMAKLESVYDAIEQCGGPQPAIFPINFESATAQDYAQLKNALNEEFGKIDGLLHSAVTTGTCTPISQHSIDEWLTLMHVNVTAPFMLTQCLLPLLQQSNDASVIFTGTDVGYQGKAYWGGYAASKAAQENLMQSLADEFCDSTKLRFNSINPGPTRTALRVNLYPAENPNSVPSAESHIAQYLYLLGPASQGVSGQQFKIELKM
jgi:NAD(P)-dependent dehydrogenase (short-subunit alcohol dehydrogenase family)